MADGFLARVNVLASRGVVDDASSFGLRSDPATVDGDVAGFTLDGNAEDIEFDAPRMFTAAGDISPHDCFFPSRVAASSASSRVVASNVTCEAAG